MRTSRPLIGASSGNLLEAVVSMCIRASIDMRLYRWQHGAAVLLFWITGCARAIFGSARIHIVALQVGLAFYVYLLAGTVYAENPVRVSSCQVKNNPAAYNHKLIEVTAFVSHGFEDFTLFDPDCPSSPQVWLEYGGTISSGTMYWGGGTANRIRSKPLRLENFLIPLVNDQRFREFDRLVQAGPDSIVRATMIGRFFSGQKQRLPGGVVWVGYGHAGLYSLFAIQQVTSVDAHSRTDLDYRASPLEPELAGCGYQGLISEEPTASALAAQQKAEHGLSEWIFSEPLRVASSAMAKAFNLDPTTITGLKQMRQSQARIVYEWKPRGVQKTYLIVASRPYWLSLYAEDPKMVAWVVIAAWEISCN